MTPINRQASTYRRDCKSLHIDLTTLIEDLRDTYDGTTQVNYGVDFSELFSYCARENTFREMRLFVDDDEGTLRATESAALTALFERGASLLLLTPYAIELKNYVQTLQARTAHDTQREVAEAHAALLTLRRSLPAEVFERSSQNEADLSKEELEVLEEHGGKIMALVRRRYERPEHRLSRLLKTNSFGTTDALLPPTTHHDEAVADRWFGYLREARTGRPSGSSYLDAVAAGLLYASLPRWKEQNVRVRIVTRSRHMVTLGDREFTNGLWPYRPIMHARVFSLVPWAAAADSAQGEALKGLEELAQSLAAFLTSYQELRTRPSTSMALALERARARSESASGMNDVDQQIDDIKRQWRARVQLVSSMGGATLEQTEPGNEPLLKLVRSVVNDDGILHGLITARLQELLENVGQQNAFLGLALHESSHSVAERAFRHLSYEVHGGKAVLSSAFNWMPCTLEFSSSDLKSLTDGFVQGRRLSADDMLRALRQHFDVAMDYERTLSMAYLAGCWRLWDLANIYCDLALQKSGHDHHKNPMHEGFFFKAVCLRMTALGEDDYQRALDCIGGAAASKALLRQPEYQDPRYLKEEATTLFAWHSRFPVSDKKRLSIEDAVRIAERALTNVAGDIWLRAQILNNLCYFFADQADTGDSARARGYYERFTDALQPIGAEYASWPPNYIDTVAWARFKLGFDNAPRALSAMLETALKLPLDERSKAAIENHLDTIRRAA